MPAFTRNLWLLLAQNLAAFLGIAVQGLVLNLYLVGLGYREDFIGLVAFVQTAAIGGGALPASWLSPRLGPRRVLIGATVVLGVAFAGMAVLEQPAPLLAASVLSGLAMAHVFVPSAPFLMENAHPEQRSSAFAANFAALSIASVAGSALGGLLPAVVAGGDMGLGVAGYRAALVVGAALTGLGAAPLLLADDSRVAAAATPAKPSTKVVRPRSVGRDLAAMAAAIALLAGGTGLVVQFFNVYLRDVVGSPTETIGSVFALASLAMAPASLIGPAAARRFGAVLVIDLARIAVVPFLLALAALPAGLELAAGVYVVRSALVSVSQPLDNAFGMELVPPTLRARVAAVRTIAWNGGWALTTGLGGFSIVALGYGPIFFASAFLALASVAVHWVAFRGR